MAGKGVHLIRSDPLTGIQIHTHHAKTGYLRPEFCFLRTEEQAWNAINGLAIDVQSRDCNRDGTKVLKTVI